jgi:hypothetical protein
MNSVPPLRKMLEKLNQHLPSNIDKVPQKESPPTSARSTCSSSSSTSSGPSPNSTQTLHQALHSVTPHQTNHGSSVRDIQLLNYDKVKADALLPSFDPIRKALLLQALRWVTSIFLVIKGTKFSRGSAKRQGNRDK